MQRWAVLTFNLALSIGPIWAQVPPCRIRHLAAADDGGSALGSTYTRLTLTNVSQADCRIEGPPRIQQYDWTGRRGEAVVEWPVRIVAEAEGARSVVLAPAHGTVLEIQTLNSTGYAPGKNCGVRLVISLPRTGHGALSIPVESCGLIRISGYLPAGEGRLH
ncbi:MAG: DUF4232 domain-containing protein [Paludibaculum sp.]